MSRWEEPWAKPRRRCDHFSADELARIRDAYSKNVPAREIARQLACSVRVIHTHYMRMDGRRPDVGSRGNPKVIPKRPKKAAPVREKRFYSSNFEPS